jgi:hypothetical protein
VVRSTNEVAKSLLEQARRLLGLEVEPPKATMGDSQSGHAARPPASSGMTLTAGEQSATSGRGASVPSPSALEQQTQCSGAQERLPTAAIASGWGSTRGIGWRLYDLDYDKLVQWVSTHSHSLSHMEEVCDAFRHNWKSWRHQRPVSWSGPDRYVEWEQQCALLREQASCTTEEKINSAAAAVATPLPEVVPPQAESRADNYSRCLEAAICNWDSKDVLQKVASELRATFGRASVSVSSGPVAVLERLERRLHELLWMQPTRRPEQSLALSRKTRSAGSPPRCPKWPSEAAEPALVALAADTFFHSNGMLRFMGYRVGAGSTLTRARRRRILDYVFLGQLPLVNDRHYMREWGKPRTSARLRKLANAVATFARNARRKRRNNYRQAIADWEADLAYLKNKFYDRRPRDWKWPQTVSRGRS